MAANYSRPPGAYKETRVPWNKTLREQWRNLLKTGSLPNSWSPTTGSSRTSPTMAFTIAQRLVLRHWLLVFDEIQLLDASSAVLLDVLSWFWRMGGIIVATSNKVPEDLYKNRVQQERLGPFVEALKMRCPVMTMRSKKDWRQEKRQDGLGRTWYMTKQRSEFEYLIKDLTKFHATSPSIAFTANLSLSSRNSI